MSWGDIRNFNDDPMDSKNWLKKIVIYEDEWSCVRLYKTAKSLLTEIALKWFKAFEKNKITNRNEFKKKFKK